MGTGSLAKRSLVLLVLFGAKRIPGMMKNIGKGISEFNSEKNSKHSEDNDQSENDQIACEINASSAKASRCWTVKEKMAENKLVKSNLEQNIKLPPYLFFNKKTLTINYSRYPSPEEYNNGDIDTSLVVE